MNFEIIGEITNIEIIAVGSSIREVERLRKVYGTGRWRKLKGIATVILKDGVERSLPVSSGLFCTYRSWRTPDD